MNSYFSALCDDAWMQRGRAYMAIDWIKYREGAREREMEEIEFLYDITQFFGAQLVVVG